MIRRITRFVIALCSLSLPVAAQNISTVAGIGSSSFSGDGGLATAAELASPVSVARDASGNVYIVDQGNHRIRKINAATGNISTIAGTSTPGYSGDGGAATSAQLYYPAGIAVDGSGNVYIADKANQRVRKITASTGVITTIAGTGTAGFSGDGAAATSAKLDNPSAVALDGSGNVYISDQYNQRIRKITVSTGNISTVAGKGSYGYSGDGAAATAAELGNPAGLRVDGSGNIYVADLFNHVIRKITASTGVITTIAGTGTAGFSGDGAAATAAKLDYPTDVSLDDSGNLYIAAQYSHRIRKISAASGNIATIAGNGTPGYGGDGGPAIAASLYYPTGLQTDGSGNVYVADRENNRIRFICNWNVLPVVTSPVVYCQGVTATALTATGSSLKWWSSRSGGTSSATAPVPSTATPGTTVYYVSTTSPAGCDGPRDSITVTVNPAPAAPAVTTYVSYCIGDTATALTATGTGLKWYTVATGGTGSTTAPVPSTSTPGITNYYVTQSLATTGCESPRSLIVVTVNAFPSAPTVTTPMNYCVGAVVSSLAASGGVIKWYTTATGGVGSPTAPTPLTTTPGTTTYYVSTTTSSGCEGPRAAIVVNIHAAPAAPSVTTPVTYCQGVTATALTATGTSLKWYTTATGGTGSTTAYVPATGTAGTFKYYVSQTNASGCESPRDSITVTINPLPAAPVVTSPVAYCTGASATALSATGTSLKWYTVASGGTALSSAPVPVTTAAGSTTYYVSSTSALGCEGPRAAIVVNVSAGPAAPAVTATVNYCMGVTPVALTATGTSLLWYTVATGGTGSTTAPTPSTAATGTTVWYVSQTTSCGESPRAAITVNINPVPAAPAVTSPVTYCQGAPALPLTATGTTLKWYTTLTGGVPIGTPTPSTGTAGTTTYYVSQTNASGCESSRTPLTVIVNPAPAAPLVTSPVNYCVGATATALTATGTGLLWYTVPTGGTGSTTAPVPSTTAAGSTTWYVSQTADTSGCEGLRAAIVVNVYAAPAAPAVTTPVNYCVGATTTALTATGTGLLWYSGATGGTGVSTAPVPSSATAGTQTYYVSQTSAAGCGESPRALITVNINALPAAPTVSSPVTYCIGATATALTATGTTLKWYTTRTGGTPLGAAPVPATGTAGTVKYYVSQTNAAGCESIRDSVSVVVNAAPAAPVVTSPLTYCVGDVAAALTATGTSLQWYAAATGGTGSATAPVPTTTAAGTQSYYVSQTSGCESPRALITVNVYSPAAAPAVTSPVNYCKDAVASALSATGTSLKWYTVPTGGTPTTTAPVPATGTVGTQTWYVTQTAAVGCGESPRAAITVNINALPAAPVVGTTTYSYCAGATATVLSATGTSLKWYTVATGGTGATTAPVPSTTTAGVFYHYVSQTNAAGCESPRTVITVTINARPDSPAVTSPVEYCAEAPSVALTATGTSLKWYALPTGGTPLAAAPVPSTSSTGATTYYVSQTNAVGCESPRSAINVIVYATPPAPTVGFIVTVCVGGTPMPLTATGSGLKWYSALTGGVGSTTPPSPGTGTPGSTLYYVSQTSSSGCESPRSAIRVNVDTLLPRPVVSSPVTYCQDDTATALTATGINIRWYANRADTIALTTPLIPSTAVAGTRKYYVSQTSAAGCESPRDSVTIIINPKPLAPVVTTPVAYCVGITATALTATGTSLKWYTAASGGTALASAPVPSTATAGTTTYYVSSTSALGCEGPRAAIVVNINDLPAAPAVTTPVNYCVGATATALTATGTTLRWYTVATGGTPLSAAPVPATTAAGTTTYYVSQYSGLGCESPRAAITVNINALPARPVVVTPVAYCVDATATALSATGTSLKWYTTATGGTGSATAPVPVTTTAGTFKHYVTQTNSNGCESPRDSITVNINPLPAAPVVVTPVEYCVGITATALTATGTTLKWYTAASGGTALASAPVPSTATAGTTTYYVSSTSTLGCEGPRAAIVVNINDLPAAPAVTTPVNYCVGATATALTATGTTLRWYTVATGGTALSAAPVPVTTAAGTTTYYVSQYSGLGCEGPRAAITVNINALPARPVVVTPVAYCVDATATALSATGTSLKWYTTATGGTGSATAPVPVTTTAGTFKHYVTQTNSNGCESPRDSITVNINPLPAAPVVVTPVEYCVGITATALTATGTSLKWYNVATGGTALPSAPVPSTTTAGTTTYYVSSTSALGCEGSRAAIVVNVNDLPAAPVVTTPVNYCLGATATALTASGTSLRWYTVASGGTALSAAPVPVTTTVGSTVYYVSQYSGVGCEGPRAAITVNINALPAPPSVVTPVAYCVGATATALSATGTSLKWYTTATGGTGSATAPVPVTTTAGTFKHYVTQTNSNGCESPRDSITVNINPLPAAPVVVTPVEYCVGITATALTATGTSLKWYTVATGGTALSAAPVPSTATAGATSYYVSSTSSAGCEGPRAEIVVQINTLPAAPPVTSPLNYCVGDTAKALTATGSSLRWYTVATGGTALSAAPVPATTAPGTFTWYVTQYSGLGCESPRSAITVNVYATPAAPAVTATVSYCAGETAAALSATGTSLKWYTVATGGTATTTTPVPSTATAGTFTWYVSQTNINDCEGPRALITVTVNPVPAAPVVTTPVNYCVGAAATALTATGISLKWYTVATGGTALSAAPVPSTATAGTVTYYVSSTAVAGCEGPRAAIVVNINDIPAAPAVTTPVNYCVGATATALTATGTSLKWYTAATGGTGGTVAPVPVTASAGTVVYYVSQTSAAVCEGPRSAITVNVNPVPAAPVVVTPVIYCEKATATTLSATGTSLKWYTTATGGTATTAVPVPSTSSAGTTIWYVSQTNTGGCESPRAAITVQVSPAPDAPTVISPIGYCIGGTAVPLTATGINLKWYTAATGGTALPAAPVPPTATAGSTTWYVSSSSTLGCEGPRSAIEVLITPVPDVTITPLGSPSFVYCKDDSVVLKAVSAAAVSFQWFRGSALLPGETADIYKAYTVADYTVVVKNSIGCEGRAMVHVSDNPLPLPTLSPTSLKFCPNVNVVLYCRPTGTGYKYEWIKDGTTIPGVSGSDLVINKAGDYKVRVTDIYGCETITNTSTTTTYPAPVKPVIVITGSGLRIGTGYSSYQWYRNDKKVSGATANTYNTGFAGKYFVEVTDVNGCTAYSDTVSYMETAIRELEPGSISIYPNPAQSLVHIDAPLKVNVRVTDITGRLILSHKDVKEVDLELYADGIYLFTITDEAGNIVLVERINKSSVKQ